MKRFWACFLVMVLLLQTTVVQATEMDDLVYIAESLEELNEEEGNDIWADCEEEDDSLSFDMGEDIIDENADIGDEILLIEDEPEGLDLSEDEELVEISEDDMKIEQEEILETENEVLEDTEDWGTDIPFSMEEWEEYLTESFSNSDCVSRAEWLYDLVETFGFSVEEDSYPTDYFADLETGSKFYYDALLAVQFELIDVKKGGYLYPTYPVTRAFAADTLNSCLECQVDTASGYSYEDVELVENPDNAQAAVELGWLDLINGRFSPDTFITIKEAEGMLAYAQMILNSEVVDTDAKDGYVDFADDVVAMSEDVEAWINEDGELTIVNPDQKIRVGQKFAVYLYGIPVVYTALEITEYDGYIVVKTEEVDREEAYDDINMQGVIDASAIIWDDSDCELAETVEEETSVHALDGSHQLNVTKLNVKKKIKIGNTSATVSTDFSNMFVSYKVTSDQVMLQFEADSKVSYSINIDLGTPITEGKSIALIPGLIPGIGGIDVILDYKADAKVSLVQESYLKVGFNHVSNTTSLIYTKTLKYWSLQGELTGVLGIKVRIGVINGLLPVNGYLYGEVGVKARYKIIDYAAGAVKRCRDISAWVFSEVGVEVKIRKTLFWSEKNINLFQEGWGENTSPYKIQMHYEDGVQVDRCRAKELNAATGGDTTGAVSSGGGFRGDGDSTSGGGTSTGTGSSTSAICHNPIGYLDSAEGGNGTLHLTGWAFDYDDLGANLQIHVYVGGTFREMSKLVYTNGNVVANTSRPDVADVFGSHVGNNHGFDITLPVSFTGSYPVYVYAINVGAADNADYNTKLTGAPMVVNVKSAMQTCSPPRISSSDVEGGKKISITANSGETIYYRIYRNDILIAENSAYEKLEKTYTETGTYKISAYAAKAGSYDSGWEQKSFTLNRVAQPEVIQAADANGMIVSMYCNDASASIYYSIDGNNPTKASAKYYGPLVVNTDKTVKMIATRNGYADSEITTAQIEMRTPSVPEGFQVSSGAKTAVGSDIVFSWNKDPLASVYVVTVYKDADEYDVLTSYSNKLVYNLETTGQYQFTIKARNFVGDSALAADSIEVEAMAPRTVTFIDHDDTVIEVQKVPYEGEAVLPNAPERRGHTFVKWDKENLISNVVEDLEIRATYKINTYKVIFYDASGKQVGDTQRVTFGSSAVSPEDQLIDIPTGYVFAGWHVIECASDSEADYTAVDSDMKLQAVYYWGNNDLPVVCEIISATRNTTTQNYNIEIKMTNFPESYTTAIVRTSLFTSEGKMVKSGKKEVEIGMDQTATTTVTLKYSGVASRAEVAILGFDGDDRTGSACSKLVSKEITEISDMVWTDWSDWTETEIKAPDENTEVESRTEYRYYDKVITTSSNPSLEGWIHYDTTQSYSDWGGWSNWSTVAQTPSDTKDVQTTVSYMYYCFLCPSCKRHEPYDGSCECGYPLTYANLQEVWSHTSYLNSNSERYSYCYGGTQKRYSTSIIAGEKWNFAESYLGSGSAGVVDVYLNRYITRTEYRYCTRNINTTYYFYKWGKPSEWREIVYTPTSERKVEQRTLYRMRRKVPVYSPLAGTEETGETYSFTGTLSSVTEDLEGKLATIMVYKGKNTDPNEDQIQYVGQITLGEGNTYSFSVIPKETPTELTGDYTICLGIEGSTGLIDVDMIRAPKKVYTVEYISEGVRLSLQSVEEGDNAVVPAIPQKEGYRFIGWSEHGINVQRNLVISAEYEPMQYVIAFVNNVAGTMEFETYLYGEELVLPEASDSDGHTFIEWDLGSDSNYIVTGNRVI